MKKRLEKQIRLDFERCQPLSWVLALGKRQPLRVIQSMRGMGHALLLERSPK